MQRLQAFKFELMPNGEHLRFMRRTAGACRFVYNKALTVQKENYEAGGKFIGYVTMARHLTGWRNGDETPWLRDAPVHPLQHALKDMERAYRNFFEKRAAFPQFRRRGQHDSFRYPDPKQIRLDQGNGRIFLPKLGWIRYRKSRVVPGELRNVTVSHSAGKWFISIQTRREIAQPVPRATSAIGIDVGIARFATFSDGSHLEALNSFRRHEKRLARARRSMSRKVKFSSNWKKQKARIARIHAHIANARRDYLHKATATISKNHAFVSIEDLKVRNMSKSAAGSVELPGRNVRAKSGLNKSILDQGWCEFRRQLDYKLDWQGGWLIAVPPQHTSQTCPCCGHVSADNRTTQAEFLCVECGYENHADVVGAINILARGHSAAACGEPVHLGRSTKQEPAKAIAREVSHA
ncbi:putative transposase [Paraburkholderia piptadeniae]|uniref:Transposase n=1 Tax=Paraburkholderia piptadeniae TaxID=1701573 RepID=A0A1N7SS53_9BURK|nr:RNA-guided endonuclease TnpB family protein [Paraburkholderia piptadeniae]SIT50228.1 putative transposase [Paraburkholderia piptadeniae]